MPDLTLGVSHHSSNKNEWWRSGVIYQIYPRSFADSNGDGIGDLAGITSRLDAISKLGVDAVWLSPFYKSPQKDAGYDVSNYCDVDPLFGSLRDFDALVARAHELNIRVLIDLVPNHSSDQHVWFQRALKAPAGDAARNFYHFKDGRGVDGNEPPNNWLSLFGGPAWTRTRNADGSAGQWYLHLFDSSQPDLNWANPAVQAEFESILRFWLDRGVDGFRVDQPHAMAKAAGLPDHPDIERAGAGFIEGEAAPPMWFQEEVHPIFRRWRAILDEYPGDRAMCGEAYVLPLSLMAKWVRPDEFHQTFNFRFLDANWNSENIFDVVNESFAAFDGVGAPSTWVLSNHDVIRHASRFGGDFGRATASDGIGPDAKQPDRALGLMRARGATMFMFGFPGASYIYQGEELGLPEHTTLAGEFRQDPTFTRTNGARVGRDGCRVPLPWVAGEGLANGFNTSGKSWLPQPDVYREYSRDIQNTNDDSTLNLYRKALRLRRELELGSGSFAWLPQFTGDKVLGYRNRDILVIHNFGDTAVHMPAGEIVLRSIAHLDDTNAESTRTAEAISPNETVWLRLH